MFVEVKTSSLVAAKKKYGLTDNTQTPSFPKVETPEIPKQPARSGKTSALVDAKKKYSKPTVDESFINNFINDSQSFFNDSASSYESLDWKTSKENDFNEKAKSFRSQVSQIRAFLDSDYNKFDKETESALKKYLDDVSKSESEYRSAFSDAKKLAESFATEGDYNVYKAEQQKYTVDLGKLQEELTSLKKQTEQEFDWTSSAEREKRRKLEDEIAAKEAYYEYAKLLQEDQKQLGQFAKMSKQDQQDLMTYAMERDNNLSVFNNMNTPDVVWVPGQGIQTVSPQMKSVEALNRLLKNGYTKEQINSISDAYSRKANADSAASMQEGAANLAQSNPVLANIVRVPLKLAGDYTGAADYGVETLKSLLDKSKRGQPMDPNRPGAALSQMADAIYSTTRENIESGKGGKLGGVAYGAATSLVDNIARFYAGGASKVGTLALAGASSFSDSVRDVSERGGTASQAAMKGMADAASEILTELLPLDDIIKLRSTDIGTVANLLKSALKQAGTEVATEEINFGVGLLSDALIMGDKSQANLQKQKLMSEGLSEKEAEKQVVRDILTQAGNLAAETALSAGAQAGIEGGANLYRSKSSDASLRGSEGDVAISQNTEQTPAQKGAQELGNLINDAKRIFGKEQSAVDTKTQADYDKENAQGGYPYGEGRLDNSGDRRLSQIYPGEQTGSGQEGRTELYRAVRGDGDTQGTSGGSVQSRDSEGREINDSVIEGLRESSVVDENNRPIPMYHVTDNMEFTTFGKGDVGFHFGSLDQTIKHADNRNYDNGRTFRVYLNIKNPVPVQADIMNWHANASAMRLFSEGIIDQNEYQQVLSLWSNEKSGYNDPASVKLREILESKGYDGIKYPNSYEGDGDSYIAFQDDQIIRSEITPFSKANPSVGSSDSGFDANTVGAAESRFAHDVKQSKVYENTYKNATGKAVQNIGSSLKEQAPDIGTYTAISEGESLYNAVLRTRDAESIEAEYEDLISKENWTGEDNDTAFRVLSDLMKNKQTDKFEALGRKQREQATSGGQFIQSFAKYTRTPEKAAADAFDKISQMKSYDVAKRFTKNGSFDSWKKKTQAAILDVSSQIASIENRDVESMRDMVRTLAAFRRTTAWFGKTNRLTSAAEKMVNKLDFETAKDIALAQLEKIPDDFRKRSTGEVIKSIRQMSMLYSLSSVNRNIVGNSGIALIDGLSDSTIGAALDMLVSKATGKREVGVDIKYSKEFLNAAKEAMQMGALCAELDIPMDTDSKYMSGRTRTFSPNAGPISRFMSAAEKYLSYGLGVTDKFFEGGAKAATQKSLEALGEAANLSADEISAISQNVADRRTFKEYRMFARSAKKVKQGLNVIGTENIGAGDFVMPFESVGANIAQTGVDYLSGGIGGFAEILSLMKDAKSGKTIDVGRQRKAVTDAARGLTGIGLVSVFTALASAGIISVFNDKDKDKRGLEQSENLTGAQFNVDAALRYISGKDASWKDGDYTVSLDFLEPFNSQMYIGYALSQEDSVQDILKNYTKNAFSSVWNSLIDMPLMTGISDLVDLVNGAAESVTESDPEALIDNLGKAAGTAAGSFIPAFARQAAQTIDPYYRDTTADSSAMKAVNQMMSQIPGLSYLLPKKISGLGEEQRRYAEGEGLLGFFNSFILPGKITKISPSQISGYLDDLSGSTNDKTFYPEYIAPKSFTVDGKEILVSGKEKTETYQKTYGENVARLYSDLISSDGFSELADDMQVKAFKKANEFAKEFAKASISNYDAPSSENASVESILESVFVNASGLSDDRYERAKEQGVTLSQMKRVSSAVTDELENVKNKTDYDTYRAVLDNVKQEDGSKWLQIYGMSETRLEEMEKAGKRGISSEVYVDFLEAESKLDKAFKEITTAWKEGETASLEGLSNAYEAYDALPEKAKQYFQDGLGGRLEAFANAMDAGVSEHTFIDLWKQYYELDNSSNKKSQNANQWASILDNARISGKITQAQRDTLINDLGFYSQLRQDAQKYHDLTSEGLKPDVALTVANLMTGITKTTERLSTIVNANITEAERKAAVYAYFDDNQDAKFKTITDMGFDTKTYAALYGMYSEESGDGKKARVVAKYQKEYGLTNAQAKKIYDIYAGKK